MPLLDQYGQPIDLARLRAEESGPTLAGVRQIVSDHPWQGMTPRRLGAVLRAAEQGDAVAQCEVAEDIEERDLHYRAVLSTRRLQVSQLPISVEAASDETADQRAADLVRETLVESGVIQAYLFDMLDAVSKGWSVGEIIWRTGTRWEPARIEWRDPAWFEFSRADGRTLMLRGGPEGIGPAAPLKPYGYVAHIHRTKSGLPVRGGLVRPACWLILFKSLDIKAWIELCEGYGQPSRLGKYRPGASEEDKRTLLRAVQSMWKDSAAIIPEGMAIEWLESKLTGDTTLQQSFADWCDRQVSKLVLGQTGTTDVGQHVGTADAHEHVKDDIERDDASQLATTLVRDLVRPVVDLNLGPMARYPRLRIARPDAVDTELFMRTVERYVNLGGEVEQSVVRDRLGLPDPPETTAGGKPVKLLRPSTTPTAPPADPGAPDPGTLATAAQQPPAADPAAAPDALDALVVEALADWEPLMQGAIDPIERLAADCTSAEEFTRRLPELLGEMDVAALTEALARACFAARAAGEVEADVG